MLLLHSWPSHVLGVLWNFSFGASAVVDGAAFSPPGIPHELHILLLDFNEFVDIWLQMQTFHPGGYVCLYFKSLLKHGC